jgi:hypothetical protein
MSDPNTNDDIPVTAPPPTAAAPPPVVVAPAAVEPIARGWRDRRVPWVVAGGAALLACLLGAGAATVGAVVIGHSGRDDHGPAQMRDRDNRQFPGGQYNGERGDGGRGDGRTRDGGPGVPAPAPSGSAVPSPS